MRRIDLKCRISVIPDCKAYGEALYPQSTHPLPYFVPVQDLPASTHTEYLFDVCADITLRFQFLIFVAIPATAHSTHSCYCWPYNHAITYHTQRTAMISMSRCCPL